VCKCTPNIRTPFCGKGDCVPPDVQRARAAPKIFVVAQSSWLAKAFMRHCMLEPDQWTFVHDSRQLMGVENCVIMQVGPLPGTQDEVDRWLQLFRMRGWPRNVIMRLPG
jgi:hypothetical protein